MVDAATRPRQVEVIRDERMWSPPCRVPSGNGSPAIPPTCTASACAQLVQPLAAIALLALALQKELTQRLGLRQPRRNGSQLRDRQLARNCRRCCHVVAHHRHDPEARILVALMHRTHDRHASPLAIDSREAFAADVERLIQGLLAIRRRLFHFGWQQSRSNAENRSGMHIVGRGAL